MKLLTEYLSTKVNANIIGAFPKYPIFNDFISYLEYNGFEDISTKLNSSDVDRYFDKYAKKFNNPIFIIKKLFENDNNCNLYWIRISKGQPIDPIDNPLLFSYLIDTYNFSEDKFKNSLHELVSANFIAYDISNDKKILTWTDFRNIFEKNFKI